MHTRSLILLTTLCTVGVLSLTDLVWVRAQTVPEAQGPTPNATGTGTAGRIVKWLTATSQGDSVLFESAGKIGLGTTTPTEALTVQTARSAGKWGVVHTDGITTVGTWLWNGATGGAMAGIGTKSNAPLHLLTNGVPRLTINTQGRVGIGAPPNQARLYVVSTDVGVPGVWGTSSSTGVYGTSSSGTGVYGTSVSSSGMRGTSVIGIGVLGESRSGSGVFGQSVSGWGVYGYTDGDGYQNTAAVYGNARGPSGIGVKGFAGPGAGGTGVWGISTGGNYAGWFDGKVHVTGTLTKGGGAFKIDHPLDPENKYLSHSFVESPDMKNIYDGTVTLNAQGQATVHLPSYFSALNKDFRYQLTAIGAPGPNLHIAKEIANNRFTIAGGSAGQKVSWQVTGIRQDAYAEAHRIVVEEDKPKRERGFFLHPEAFGEPEEQGIQWGIRPEAMRQMQAERAALAAQGQEGSGRSQ